ncbi:MAG TPA: signal peptide peptidase SppA [Bacteroidales bacterium]|nr:signal peptide peptidase SppA [Bacteroidales bacterium]
MKSFLKYTLATIAGILVLNVIGIIIIIIIASASGPDVPELKDNTVLLAKFNKPIIDRENENPLSQFTQGTFDVDGTIGLDKILSSLEKAKRDDNISGIFLRLTAIPASMATVEEIRDALIDFKESGKFIIAHADTWLQKSYYLASVADKVYLTPTGDFAFSGMSTTVAYFKRALDKYGVDMQVIRHGSFKSAVEPFLTDEMSDENREQLSVLLGTIWQQVIEGISESRDIPKQTLQEYADNLSVAFDHQALEKNMIDSIKYYDEVLNELKEMTDTELDDDIEAISLEKYYKVPDKNKEISRNRIAVVYAMGTVVTGEAEEGMIGSDRIARAIRKARKDDKIKAIVFRVNSGGGSALASEVIYREVKLAAEVKPVIASLGDVAASGGYYIVAPADTIVASESTITGSIGVFGVLPNLKELMNDKIGITTGTVKTAKYSDLGQFNRPLTADERAMIQSYVDDVYTTFVNHVADDRSMTFEEVDAIGGGRVWSGISAREVGLIDMFGGLQKSIELAAEMAELEDYRVTSRPIQKDPFTEIMKQLSGGVKAKIIQKELGESYEIYQKIEEIKNMKGIQAIMPYEIDIH